MKRPSGVIAVTTALLLTAACGNASSGAGGASQAETQTLTVFAAASLKGTFTELGRQYETNHPGTKVAFSFAGSSDLVTQLQGGAPADVFASADTRNMDKATGDNLIEGTPVNFASNTLEIAVPSDNPAKVTSFQDLTKDGVKVVVCAAQVPCGSATQKVEEATGLTIKPVSEESSVTDVLNKVTSGEADAGVVYKTDVMSAGDKVTGITFPESSKAVNVYPIGVLAGSRNSDAAQQFVDLVTGAEGRKILTQAGFSAP